MKILWVSNLVGVGTSKDPIRPKIENIRNLNAKSFPCSWFITTKPVGFAIGIADVNTTQLTVIQSDTDIITFNLSDAQLKFDQLATEKKTRLTSLASKLSVTTKANQSLNEILEAMLGIFCLSKVSDISSQMLRNFGV